MLACIIAEAGRACSFDKLRTGSAPIRQGIALHP
jgi:hypothetical protein